MLSRRRQWAWTASDAVYPPYVNVSELEDGSFEVTVRAPATSDGRCGETVSMPIPARSLKVLVDELHGALALR